MESLVGSTVTALTPVSPLNVSDPESDTFNCLVSNVAPTVTGFAVTLVGTDYNFFMTSNPGFEHDDDNLYTVTITCTDSNSEAASGDISVNILPNTPPTIAGMPAFENVLEGESVTRLVYTISVSDVESDTYTCAITPTNFPFNLQLNGAVYSIHLNDNPSLNHAATPSYTITITCTDAFGESNGGVLQITVTPNNAPVMSGLPATVSVSNIETASRSLKTVTVTDSDGQTVTCSVTSSPSGPFSMVQDYKVYLDANSNTAIAAAAATTFAVTVSCTDSTDTTSAVLTVDVTSNNYPSLDNLPAFVNLDESAVGSTAVADTLLTLTVTEPDGETYWCELTPAVTGFALLDNSGTYNVYLAINPGFEYDTMSQYTLSITCTDQNGNAATDTVTVNLLPNTPPTFSGMPASVTVSEGTLISTNIYSISVTDTDSFTCAIGTTTPASAPFSILFGTSVYLDAGAGLATTQYVVPIVCSDSYGSSTGTLTVNVSPNGDPVITGLPVTLSVDETETAGRDLHILVVTDPEGDVITCSVTSSPTGPFSIVQDLAIPEYKLYLDANANLQLNSAVATQHVLTVTCSDANGGSTSGTVYVDVTGNVAPVFTGLPDVYSISENQATEILIWALAVTDPESNPFICSMSVVPSSTPFDLRKNTTTGVYNLYILSNPGFHYDTIQSYIVTFTCVDSPQGASGTAVLTVEIIENRPPQFTNIPGVVSPNPDALNTVIYTSLFTVTATDADQDQVYFSMTADPTTDSFAINTATGEITAARDLQTELISVYVLNVTATDNKLSTSALLTLTLTNINTAPTITNLVLNSVTSVSFSETSAYRTLIYTLNVYDPDSGQTQYVTFDTTPSTEAALFNLTNNAVSLTARKLFNFEDQITYMLAFYVTDSIHMIGPYYLQITVLEEGERCYFDKTLYEATVDEAGIGSGTINLGFSITDPDNPDSHTYTIRSGDDAHLFAIDSTTGIITFAVNYDVDSGSNHPQNATIIIQCTDTYSLTGTATVSIYVDDINDNAPDFNSGGYVVEVNQYDNLGHAIGTLNATDKDSGNNGEVEYTGTSSTGGSYYKIAKNGQILLLSALTFEYGTAHRFHVTAVDHGSPQLTGTTYVDIVYRYRTTTTPTTTTTTLAPTDFWTVENIALIASLGALALLGLAVLLFMLLRNTGCCSGVNGPSSCRQMCKCHKKSPNRVVVTPKNPKASEWKLWDNNDLNIQRKPFVTNVTETAIPQTMKM
ncbi:Protein dachsous [Mizuhopecten yessoensis]|uniref:Protein dachsous n=1 Tax=Mizuhopecten yessoensis TaxID=6573 RepID=A0A210PPT8_MIZYE|nr:Protein dachsous [Mizuhopecten yessoensis]